MTAEEIKKLLEQVCFMEPEPDKELIETHISWVLLCGRFAYKIKKPVRYSFLDFSTITKRKYCCLREIELNQRLCENIYLGVVPVKVHLGVFFLGEGPGELIDYAVKMNRLDETRRMDVLLKNDHVKPEDITNLALKIAAFHRTARIIDRKNFTDIQEKFNDLQSELDFISHELSPGTSSSIQTAIRLSNHFIKKNSTLFKSRMQEGFFRDCHGDLHTRNIFLLPAPQPFDCIEFNDDFRQIDTLNEIAFLCMDLDSFGRTDFSRLFLDCYNQAFFSMRNKEESLLFIYYKSYRANIRAKVYSLRARSAADDLSRKAALRHCVSYLLQMNGYLNTLDL